MFYDLPTEIHDKILANSNISRDELVGFTDYNSDYTDNGNAAQIVLLSQNLKKCGYGYRDLIGQVKNIGNATASSIQVSYTTYDKEEGVSGTDYSYVDAEMNYSLTKNLHSKYLHDAMTLKE